MMSEQDRVNKAIADGGINPIRPSVEEVERYSGRVAQRIGEISRQAFAPRLDHRVPFYLLDEAGDLPVTASNFIYPLNDAERSSWDQLTLPEPLDTGTAVMLERERERRAMMNNMWSYLGLGSAFGSFMPDGVMPETTTAVLEAPPEMPRPSKDILQRAVIPETIITDMRADLAVEAETLLGYSVLRKRLGMKSPLTEALLKLEIEPFDPASVEKYKSEMLAYAQNEAARMDVAEGIRPGTWQARQACWQSEPIREYRKPIPEFAIDTAVRLKKACPAVKFEIEELTIVPDPFLIAVLGKQRRYIEVWDEPKFEGR